MPTPSPATPTPTEAKLQVAAQAAAAALSDTFDLIRNERIDGTHLQVHAERRAPYESRGDATVVVRMSSADLKAGETVHTQLEGVLAFAHRSKLHVGYVVIATECSGGRTYWSRPDFAVVEQLIAEGRCGSVVWRDVSRMARERQAYLDHTRLLEETGTRLHVHFFGCEIEWGNPAHTMMSVQQLEFAIMERDATFRRTQAGIRGNCIFNGKGIHSRVRLGFRKRSDGWIEVDPQTWPLAKAVHLAFHALRTEDDPATAISTLFATIGITVSADEVRKAQGSEREANGLRALARVLELAGLKRSVNALNQILRDSIYLNGHYTSTYGGAPVAMKPIEIPDPVPSSVFAINQTLLDLADGAALRSKLGGFALKRRVTCGCCGGTLAPRFVGKDAVYYHAKVRRGSSCAGLAIDARAFDAAVIDRLRQLELSSELRAEAFELAKDRRGKVQDDHVLTQRRAELDAELGRLQRRFAEAMKTICSEEACLPHENGEDSGSYVVQRMIESGAGELSQEIARVERAREVADAVIEHRQREHPRIVKFESDLSTTFLDIVTVAEPDDVKKLARRAAVLEAAISNIRVTPILRDGKHAVRVEIEGACGPLHESLRYPVAPSSTSADQLRDHIRTVNSSYDYETVRMIFRDYSEREAGEYLALNMASEKQLQEVPDWVLEFELSGPDQISRHRGAATRTAVTDEQPVSPTSQAPVLPATFPWAGGEDASGQQTLF